MWKMKTGTEEVVKYAPLGLFPATAEISKDGEFLYVANAHFSRRIWSPFFGFRGGHRPDHRSEAHHDLHDAARFATEARWNETIFSDDGIMVTEIDTQKFDVARTFMLSAGRNGHGRRAAHAQMNMKELTCVPTWAQPSNDGSEIMSLATNRTISR